MLVNHHLVKLEKQLNQQGKKESILDVANSCHKCKPTLIKFKLPASINRSSNVTNPASVSD